METCLKGRSGSVHCSGRQLGLAELWAPFMTEAKRTEPGGHMKRGVRRISVSFLKKPPCSCFHLQLKHFSFLQSPLKGTKWT